MRLFVLPISTRRSLIYCQKSIALSPEKLTLFKNPIEKVASQLSQVWLYWERKPRGVKKRITVYGNKLFKRLHFEEWGLKSVPPLWAKRKEEELQGKIKSQVEYPQSLLRQEAVQEALEQYGSNERQQYHRKWFWGSVIGMPLSLPVGVIPIIPNLPLLYLSFRAYSHWRAGHGSKHIDFLVKNSLFETRPSSVLDKAYAISSIGSSWRSFQQDLSASKQAIIQPTASTEQLLLSQADGIMIADCLQIPEIAVEVERAVWQIEKEIKAQNELDDEKSKLRSAEENNKGHV